MSLVILQYPTTYSKNFVYGTNDFSNNLTQFVSVTD